jgi:hypothetical protein
MSATLSIADTESAETNAATTSLAIADELTAAGYGTQSPIWDGSAYLKIHNARGALCDLTIKTDGTVIWDYRTRDGQHIDPRQLARIALDLLSPRSRQHPAAVPARQPGTTLTSAVAQTLTRHGIRVTPGLTDHDHHTGETYTEIQATSPASPARGTICVTDDGALIWQCRTHPHPGGLTPDDIAATPTRALIGAQHTPCHA